MKYGQRGVSAGKEEVHKAIEGLDKGLYPDAFCKILPDIVSGDPAYCNILHADTAGTKTSLAYLFWKETQDHSVWEGIVQDAIVMNLDDIACCGVPDHFVFSNTIGRNKNLIPGSVLESLIQGAENFFRKMRKHNINAYGAGGETADVGDLVRTLDVGFTAFSRMPRNKVFQNHIQPDDVVVALASYGQTTYEDSYNSGIGSNGLTFARHEVLRHTYADAYPESFDPAIEKSLVYSGSKQLTDLYRKSPLNVGQLLLSPTRTYTPFLKSLFDHKPENLHGIIHCTGGGLTKVLHFLNDVHVIKDQPLAIPEVFNLIREENNTPWKEMYQVFNMGQRLELYLPESEAQQVIDLASTFNIEARIIGRCEASSAPRVTVQTPEGAAVYNG